MRVQSTLQNPILSMSSPDPHTHSMREIGRKATSMSQRKKLVPVFSQPVQTALHLCAPAWSPGLQTGSPELSISAHPCLPPVSSLPFQDRPHPQPPNSPPPHPPPPQVLNTCCCRLAGETALSSSPLLHRSVCGDVRFICIPISQSASTLQQAVHLCMDQALSLGLSSPAAYNHDRITFNPILTVPGLHCKFCTCSLTKCAHLRAVGTVRIPISQIKILLKFKNLAKVMHVISGREGI